VPFFQGPHDTRFSDRIRGVDDRSHLLRNQRLVKIDSPPERSAGRIKKWHGVAVLERVSSICSSVNMDGVQPGEISFCLDTNPPSCRPWSCSSSAGRFTVCPSAHSGDLALVPRPTTQSVPRLLTTALSQMGLFFDADSLRIAVKLLMKIAWGKRGGFILQFSSSCSCSAGLVLPPTA
jgi:hypothetical protein